ncbi:MAG: 2OG-Fe(II) oxygenase [Emcibacteraceae bacterium]|nr:2OG-Fe(II) oxygenase [Emcibacteraceae bacterium]
MQENLDWKSIQTALLKNGFVIIPGILPTQQCETLIADYESDIYRSVIDMARYSFGRGQYKYYAYPLPNIISQLRQYFYQHLTAAANNWSARLKRDDVYSDNHQQYIDFCHAHGQTRPTPLILKYGSDDYNALHQDLYGEVHFPYQAAIMLSDADEYNGGEFTLIEQRPRMQSVAHVHNLQQGDAIVFAVNEFPKSGKRGYYRAKLRHGVSKIHSGKRHTLGIILHDAK